MKFLYIWSRDLHAWVFLHSAELVNGKNDYHERVRARYRAEGTATAVVTAKPLNLVLH